MRFLLAGAAGPIVAVASVAAQGRASLTDAQVKAAIVKASIASYSGACPCPFNTDSRGRRCGARSAYGRPGGRSPVCYVEDVTPKMVKAYREAQDQKRADAVPADRNE